MKGKYASMWRKQIRAERAADEAALAVAKAQALQKAAANRPRSPGSPTEGVSADVSDNEAETRAPSFILPDGGSSITHVEESREHSAEDSKSDDGAVAKVLDDDQKATTEERKADPGPSHTQ